MTLLDLIHTRFQQHHSDLRGNLNPLQFAEFLQFLNRWNQVYNLTAIRSPEEQIDLHLLDSLIIGRYLTGTTFLDVGSGGGFPGIPLAIAYPEQAWTLLDKSAKKCRFLTQAVLELKLNNVTVVDSRVEDFTPVKKFDGIVARAFSSLSEFIRLTEPLLAENGQWYAMKGVYPAEELSALPNGVQVECIRLNLKGNSPERHLICIKPIK